MERTPGPWEYEQCLRQDGVAIPYQFDVSAPTKPAPGCDEAWIFVAETRNKANARLIAAAPELLEALKALFEHCAMVHKHWGENSNAREADAAIAAAHAVISKAEGRS